MPCEYVKLTVTEPRILSYEHQYWLLKLSHHHPPVNLLNNDGTVIAILKQIGKTPPPPGTVLIIAHLKTKTQIWAFKNIYGCAFSYI